LQEFNPEINWKEGRLIGEGVKLEAIGMAWEGYKGQQQQAQIHKTYFVQEWAIEGRDQQQRWRGVLCPRAVARALKQGGSKVPLGLSSARTCAIHCYLSCDATRCPLPARCPPADCLACNPCSSGKAWKRKESQRSIYGTTKCFPISRPRVSRLLDLKITPSN
jgi:hypothetical protein